MNYSFSMPSERLAVSLQKGQQLKAELRDARQLTVQLLDQLLEWKRRRAALQSQASGPVQA